MEAKVDQKLEDLSAGTEDRAHKELQLIKAIAELGGVALKDAHQCPPKHAECDDPTAE